MGTDGSRGYVIPPRLWAWLGTRRAAAVLLWLFALGVGVHHLDHARMWGAAGTNVSERDRRADGNSGHTHIDFGGQWLMGRMLVLGHGRELYDRRQQWEVIRAGYPVSAESPVQQVDARRPPSERVFAGPKEKVTHDADRLMHWFMGADPPAWKTVGGAAAAPLAAPPGQPLTAVALAHASADAVTPEAEAAVSAPAVGGPLYPPVHALLYAPIGLFASPLEAYFVFQVFALAVVYFAGLGVRVLTRGRIWWSAASAGLLLFPGCRAATDLGQNPALSVAILVWGWVLAARGREWAGGAVWGLFAFKPVWGLAFALVPVLMVRWRFCLAMLGTGLGLAAATLPFVGLHSWFDWLAVGREAAQLYNVDYNWIMLSRDLHGIPRRVLHDFDRPVGERDTPLARILAWGLWGAVFAATVAVYLLRADRRRVTGLGAGFLFLGAFLSCYRFMYYDVMLAAVAVVVLLGGAFSPLRTRVFRLNLVPDTPLPPGRAAVPTVPPTPLGPRLLGYVNSFPLTVLAGLYLVDNLLLGLNLQATFGAGYWSRATTGADGSTGLTTPRVELETALTYPWDTALIAALWAWAGLRLIVWGDEAGNAEPDGTAGKPAAI